ncbi:MAG: type II secretion system protein, partial [Patescibacteria group bacterium]
MSRSSQTTDKGYTIIELMIVLAVAGLIFMIVFNAVPALLRNSRNNQRKQDVAAVLSAVSHYQLNHSGTFPPARPPIPTPPAVDILQYTKLSYYETTAITLNPQSAGGPAVTSTSNDEAIDVYNFHICDSNTSGATSIGAGYRDIVAI